jgi:pimeloyl-ACP methyl ester carboxylesterase
MPTEDFDVLSFRCGLRIACKLDIPDAVQGGLPPIIIMGGGLGSIVVKRGHLRPFVDTFVRQGYAALTFDYLSFGASEGSPRNVLNASHQRQDFRDVIQWARSQPNRFDLQKLVIWGSSFAGLHVTEIASGDKNNHIRTLITQCPLMDGFRASLQLPVKHVLRLITAALMDAFRSLYSNKPYYVALASNGDKSAPLALMASPEVEVGTRLCFPDNVDNYPNFVAARIVLQIPFQRPVTKVHKIRAPFLIVLPSWDGQASLPAAEEAARLAPNARSVRVAGGHFDMYEGGSGYEKNIKSQVDFLKEVFAV